MKTTSKEVSLEKVKTHLDQATNHLQEAIEQSLALKKQGLESKQDIGALWKSFIDQFMNDLRQRSREHGENLLRWVGF